MPNKSDLSPGEITEACKLYITILQNNSAIDNLQLRFNNNTLTDIKKLELFNQLPQNIQSEIHALHKIKLQWEKDIQHLINLFEGYQTDDLVIRNEVGNFLAYLKTSGPSAREKLNKLNTQLAVVSNVLTSKKGKEFLKQIKPLLTSFNVNSPLTIAVHLKSVNLPQVLEQIRLKSLDEQVTIYKQFKSVYPKMPKQLATMLKQNPGAKRDFYIIKLAGKQAEFENKKKKNRAKYEPVCNEIYDIWSKLTALQTTKPKELDTQLADCIANAKYLPQYRGVFAILKNILRTVISRVHTTESTKIIDSISSTVMTPQSNEQKGSIERRSTRSPITSQINESSELDEAYKELYKLLMQYTKVDDNLSDLLRRLTDHKQMFDKNKTNNTLEAFRNTLQSFCFLTRPNINKRQGFFYCKDPVNTLKRIDTLIEVIEDYSLPAVNQKNHAFR